jgi:hypothetical protein
MVAKRTACRRRSEDAHVLTHQLFGRPPEQMRGGVACPGHQSGALGGDLLHRLVRVVASFGRNDQPIELFAHRLDGTEAVQRAGRLVPETDRTTGVGDDDGLDHAVQCTHQERQRQAAQDVVGSRHLAPPSASSMRSGSESRRHRDVDMR